MSGEVDGTCLAAGTVAREGSFQGGEGTRAEADLVRIWPKLGGLQKVTMGGRGVF